MGMELEKNHISITSSHHVNEICKPLGILGIHYFSFIRSFKDGSHIRLSNNSAWTQHYYMRQFYSVVTSQIPDKDCNIPWSCIDEYPLFHEAAEYFNVSNGTVLVVAGKDMVERYFFGSTRDNRHVNHLYLHHADLLKKFILYFKEAAKKLIDEAEKSKIIVPNQEQSIDKIYSDENVEHFLNHIKIKNISIHAGGKDVLVTPNEAKILALMKCGYTAKETAQKIGLSSKTVEIYREKLKIKLNQFSRGNLISLANSNGLLDMNLLQPFTQCR
jgi:DNA-binding CsgD family transcriptional regulator